MTTDIPRINGTTVRSRFLFTSTGCSAVDEIVGGGLPVSGIYLIDEQKSRIYASILEKYFIAEGVIHKHNFIIASPQLRSDDLLKKLPTEVSSEGKKNGDEVAVLEKATGDSLKIAWRYSTMPKVESAVKNKKGPRYDLSKPMMAKLIDQCEVVAYPPHHDQNTPSCSYQNVWSLIKSKLSNSEHCGSSAACPKNLLRIVLEDFASPYWEDNCMVTKFLACLRALVAESLAVVMITLDSTCVEGSIRETIYSYCDAIFCLEASDQNSLMKGVVERFDGYFRIIKLPTLTSAASHCPGITDFVYELHRKYFDVRVFHLPPAFGDKDQNAAGEQQCTSILNKF